MTRSPVTDSAYVKKNRRKKLRPKVVALLARFSENTCSCENCILMVPICEFLLSSYKIGEAE